MEKLAFHSWCNKFILFRHKLSKYFVVAFYLFISTTIIFRITSQTYGVNDDVIIQDWLSGQYTGTPELMIRGSATPRITFGFIVSNLYDFIPNLNWFSIILLTTVLFSWYLLGILAFRSKNILSIFVYFLISFLHLLWYIPSPTYTASAVILSFSTLIYLARKLSEKGVRFVQLFDWGWDVHGNSTDTSLEIGLVNKCKQIDKAITALILDLKQRGLLEETLIVWGSEFGRTPMQENRNGLEMPFKGRDHHADAFTIWMCGGGAKAGTTYGETDEIGFYPVDGKVSVYDVQATILHLLGFNHETFTYPFQGRPFRLTDVEGTVIKPILS
jgi:hypothetical protein